MKIHRFLDFLAITVQAVVKSAPVTAREHQVGLSGAKFGGQFALLGPPCGQVGSSWVPPGPVWGQLGVILGLPWGMLGLLWEALGHLGKHFGPPQGTPSLPGPIFRRFWFAQLRSC